MWRRIKGLWFQIPFVLRWLLALGAGAYACFVLVMLLVLAGVFIAGCLIEHGISKPAANFERHLCAPMPAGVEVLFSEYDDGDILNNFQTWLHFKLPADKLPGVMAGIKIEPCPLSDSAMQKVKDLWPAEAGVPDGSFHAFVYEDSWSWATCMWVGAGSNEVWFMISGPMPAELLNHFKK